MKKQIVLNTTNRAEQGGFALILVLSALVLLTALVLAFFVSVTTESLASKSYGVSEQSRKLADEALNIVTSQISDATTEAANNNEAWISQPGLIRCFDTSGNLVSAYKLFSSSVMRDTNSSYDPGNAAYAQSDIPPANWYLTPALYTDLNAPVYIGNSAGTVTINSQTYTPVYPIVDPTAGYVAGTNPNGVHGFSVSGAPANASATVYNPLPMPTQWFYVLQDGTIASASGSGNTVTVTSATTANPIVGRVAFWADDDTCKVNINTAAGDLWTPDAMSGTTLTNPGSFVDMPHVDSTYDKNLAKFQPANGEFQRYPGHPATTYLSAVFPFLTRTDIGAVAPRTVAGGSVGGSAVAGGTMSAVLPPPRLFASTDELAFSNSYALPNPGIPTTNRMLIDSLTTVPSPTNISQLTPSIVSKANFFITAHSRAPETNLFNRPRVTIWPEAATSAQSDGTTTIMGDKTTFDKAIAFCSTVGGLPFYFVRNNCSSSTEDYVHYPNNQTLYTYLQALTGDGTTGGSGFDGSNIPGFGGNFKSKYGNDRDQILTEIFDYIRCANLCDASQSTISKRYTPGPATPTAINNCPSGTGQVVPIQIQATGVNTRGFGRMPTVHSPTLLIYPYNYTPSTPTQPQQGGVVKSVRALFLLEPFTVSQGIMRILPNCVFKVKGLDGFSLNGAGMGFPSVGTVTYSQTAPNHDYGWGSYEGAANLFWPGPKSLGSGSYELYSTVIPLNNGNGLAVGAEYNPPATNNEMTLTCANNIEVDVYSVDKINGTQSTNPIQTLTFSFPTTNTLVVPRPYTTVGVTLDTTPTPPPTFYQPAEDIGNRAKSTSTLVQDTYPSPYHGQPDSKIPQFVKDQGVTPFSTTMTMSETDPIRSVEPVSGDARLIAAMQNVSPNAFAPDKDYNNPAATTATDMRCGNQLAHYGNWGSLVSGAPYTYIDPDTYYPAVPSFVTQATLLNTLGTQSPGDWDTGMSMVSDGPYINKPDEGETGGANPYFTFDGVPVGVTNFSPNRQIPSAVMFGSLSTGVQHSLAAFNANDLSKLQPWQTLLFCPNPASDCKTTYTKVHPGFKSPPDHLLLDLFTMPVVEPYPISEPFSTAGKINLNYQIVPFKYINRNTGLQAVLASTRVTAIPTADAGSYKSGNSTANYRLQIDPDQTLKAFDNRFANNKPFISASEICTMFLVPQGQGLNNPSDVDMATWWSNYALTGDNLREKPYADLYGRLTTKSNTFTVHVRAQSLLKVKGSTATQWTEGTDVVTGEYRGSYTLERYLDPNLTTYNTSQPLTAYKFRVVETKQFAP